MKKVWIFSGLLVVGLGLSQVLPTALGVWTHAAQEAVTFLTMVGLAFIMIHVGYEFDLDKSKLGELGWDYVVAMTAAALPWLFVAAYAVLLLMPARAWAAYDGWSETLLASRFAAPTSAGVLFSMLAAAGLSATWMFRKARVLAIFDDLDTILLMIPLSMLIVGPAWQMGVAVVVMFTFLYLAWRWLNQWAIPCTWLWVLGYSVAIAVLSELVYQVSLAVDRDVPIHIEVLLPAFVLGCLMKPCSDPHMDDTREGHQEGLETPGEQTAAGIVSGAFMFLVGLSMPALVLGPTPVEDHPLTLSASVPMPAWPMMAVHVLNVTLLSNLGKMFPAFTYRRRVRLRERLALAVSMWPRGEVGAGILVVSLGYGLGGPLVVVALLSLALNLILTGVFILVVKKVLVYES
jgi:Kef-type K+ transport system membrane component KefB